MNRGLTVHAASSRNEPPDERVPPTLDPIGRRMPSNASQDSNASGETRVGSDRTRGNRGCAGLGERLCPAQPRSSADGHDHRLFVTRRHTAQSNPLASHSMASRAQLARHRTDGRWWTTPTAALCPALAVLLAVLTVCLGHVVQRGGGDHPAPMTSVTAGITASASTVEYHAVPTVLQDGCSSRGACCAAAVQDVAGVLATSVQPVQAILPWPNMPRPDVSRVIPAQPPPTENAPDLHVLQVQRI